MSDKKKRFPLEYVPVAAIRPYDGNVQHQDDETYAELVAGIEDGDFIKPVTVADEGDGTYGMISGEHRWRAAMDCCHEEIPALIVPGEEWDDDRRQIGVIRMNALRGKPDKDKLIAVYDRMAKKYGKEATRKMFGYTNKKEFRKLIRKVGDGMKRTLPPEQRDEFDRRAKDAKSIGDLSKIVQDLFNKHGETLEYGFMVFTYGRQQHLYVQMNAAMRRAMEKVTEYCAYTGEKLHDFMGPIVKRCADEAEKGLETAEEAVKGDAEDNVLF